MKNIFSIKNKRGAAPIIVLGLLASIVTLLYFGGVIEPASLGFASEDFIQAPYYAKVECVQSGTSKYFDGNIAKEGEWISDKLPKNTNEWSITVTENGGKFGCSMPYFEYYICPQKGINDNCKRYDDKNNPVGDSKFLGTFSSDSHIWIQKQVACFTIRSSVDDKATYNVAYKPFELRGTDVFRGGDQPVLDAIGCQVPYTDPAWQNRILSATGIVLPDGTVKSRDLRPGEKFNYISGTVTRLAEGNMQDGGYCIYSNGKGNIYPISQLTTPKTVYNVVDVTRSPIKTVQCCNGDNLPDKTCVDGKWVSTAGAQCSFLNPCEGTEWRADLNNEGQAIRYACVQGQCQAQTKEVECTIDSQCSTNQKCNQNTFTCEQASLVGGAGDERLPTDQATCEKKGYKWVPEKQTKTGILGIYGKVVTVEAHCEKPNTLKTILWIAGLALAVFMFILLRPLIFGIFKSLRGILKGLPFVGKFFP